MKKNVPLYDVIIVGVFLALLVYYLLVQGPIKTQTQQLTVQKQELENEVVMLEPYMKQMQTWRDELEELKKQGNPTSIPDYDNIDHIINEMHTLLDDSGGFSVNYGEITCENNIVTRNIDISFTTNNYSDMKAKIEDIRNSEYKYQITDLSITGSNSGTYSCKMHIVAHEYSENGTI